MRMKLMCMITMDAHSRDIIGKLFDEKVGNADEFQWQSQLKVYWDDNKKDLCIIKQTGKGYTYSSYYDKFGECDF